MRIPYPALFPVVVVLPLLAGCPPETGGGENHAPIAVAGEDFSVSVGEAAGFDGSESSDPDGDALTFAWRFREIPTGSAASLEDADTAEAWFVPDVRGDYVVELVVSDGELDSKPDTVTVTALEEPSNRPPVADAGQDRQVAVGETVTLDGSGSSDPDGDPITYAWSLDSVPAGSNAQLVGADTATPSFTADLAGDYVVTLVVRDATLDSAPDSVTVTATEGPSAPTWSATYGASGSDEYERIAFHPAGGLVAVGSTPGAAQGVDVDGSWVHVGADGSVRSALAYGGPQDDMLIVVKATGDGFITSGWTRSFGAGDYDVWVTKLDSSGSVVWSKAYGGSGAEQAYGLDLLPDGGYVFCGGTTSFGAGGSDIWVVRIDATGQVVWEAAYGGSGDDAPGAPYDEYVCGVAVDAEGKIVVVSVSDSYEPNFDLLALRLDPADGTVLWSNGYGGDGEESNWSVGVLADGGYLLTGSFGDPSTFESDAWALKVDTTGAIVWQTTLGIPGIFDEVLKETGTADGGAVLATYYENSDSDWRSRLIRLSADGQLMWARDYQNGQVSWPNDVLERPDGRLSVVGVSVGDVATWDGELWLMETEADGTVATGCALGTPVQIESTTPGATQKSVMVTTTSSAATVTDVSISPRTLSRTPTYQCP
ncbi:MAG: hypothetical protein D6729_11640 [Deltaproteobacteria bacterium]|nr:MAG: hypothetical protein D6729_11640 [Deltaproteobacteria bacterium]